MRYLTWRTLQLHYVEIAFVLQIYCPLWCRILYIGNLDKSSLEAEVRRYSTKQLFLKISQNLRKYYAEVRFNKVAGLHNQRVRQILCSVCSKGVGVNTVNCSICKHWVQKYCSKVNGPLVFNENFPRIRCQGFGSALDKIVLLLRTILEK